MIPTSKKNHTYLLDDLCIMDGVEECSKMFKSRKECHWYSVGFLLSTIMALSTAILSIVVLVSHAHILNTTGKSISIEDKYLGPTVTFPYWNNPLPCIDRKEHDFKDNQGGLFYIKVHKASSSTLAGVAEHIARKHRKDGMKHKKCYVHAKHMAAGKMNLHKRNLVQSYLWTFIRDPKERKVSSFFYFNVTRQGVNPTGPAILEDLKINNNYQYYFMLPKGMKGVDVDDSISKILNAYNFIGLVERLDESLVLLRLLLGLNAEDILYVPSKVGGSFAKLGDKCVFIQKKITTPAVDKYLTSDEWYTKNKLDYELYAAVNRSIDSTIENIIGRERFEDALSEHLKLMEVVKSTCISESIFPCSAEGIVQSNTNCYWYDIGCGYNCVDRVAGLN